MAEKKDIEIVVQANSAETMETNIDLIIKLALVGGILAIFVLWIFLKNISLFLAYFIVNFWEFCLFQF